ncbi:adenosine receptor A2b [Biomphalaria pfeifferi]|uniref:Adenosine receptor A2b n=1 Tax=Biomphalaria pfeifferi TaxID=112525 RepID=A0AAD8B9X1_BIOPF|nr:adenosine receptor A2b [Biomphalaria pfeifferi]
MDRNSSYSKDDYYLDLLHSKETIIRLVYLIIVSVGAVSGNMLVFVAILKFRSLRRATNVMLGSLAFADFLVGTVTVPLYILWMTSPGIFDSSMFMCGLVLLSCLLVVTASQISLLIMSVEQYFAVCHPFLHRNTLIHHNRLHTAAVTSTWVVSFLTTALSFLAFNTKAVACSYYGVFDKTFLFIASIFGVICPFVVIISLNIKVVCAVKAHDKRRQSLLSGASSRTRAFSSSSFISSKLDESLDSRKENDSIGSTTIFDPEDRGPRNTSSSQKLENKDALLRQFVRSFFKYNKIKRRKNTYCVSRSDQRLSRVMFRRGQEIFFVETRANAYIDNTTPLTLRLDSSSDLVHISQEKVELNICVTAADKVDRPCKSHEAEDDNTDSENRNNMGLEFTTTQKDFSCQIPKGTNLKDNIDLKKRRNRFLTKKHLSSDSESNITHYVTNNINCESVDTFRDMRRSRRLSFDPQILNNSDNNFGKFCFNPRGNNSRADKGMAIKSTQICQSRSDDLMPSFNQGSRKRDSGLGREISTGSSVSRRVANMVALVCASFIVAWCPFFVVVLMNNFCGDCDLAYFLNAVIIVAFTKSATNPLVYALCHVAFRRAYRKLLTSLCMMKTPGRLTSRHS